MKKYITFIVVAVLVVMCYSITNVYAANNSCKTIDGAYYDKNGKETDKGTYEKECFKHSCELVADAYFGKDGKEVSKEQFESECETRIVNDMPNTSSKTNIVFILLGISIILYSYLKISTINNNN